MTCKNNLLGGISKIAPWKLLIIWIIYYLPLAPFFCLESDVITGALTTFFGPWSNLEDWSQSWNWWNTNTEGFPGGTVVKNPPANARDARHAGSIPGSGKSLGAGNGNPFQCSWLGNPMDRGAWGGAVHGVTKSRVRLSDWTELNLAQGVIVVIKLFLNSYILIKNEKSKCLSGWGWGSGK